MTAHTKDALRGARITQVLDLPLTIATSEAAGAKGLIASQNRQVFNLIAAGVATVRAVIANEGAVAEQKQVGVRVEQSAACVAAETVDVPSVAGCEEVRRRRWCVLVDAEGTYQARRLCPPPISAQRGRSAIAPHVQSDRSNAYLAAALAWVDGILAVHGRLGRG